jgi:hypothetical protein
VAIAVDSVQDGRIETAIAFLDDGLDVCCADEKQCQSESRDEPIERPAARRLPLDVLLPVVAGATRPLLDHGGTQLFAGRIFLACSADNPSLR